jgi:hypothetical protein
MMAAKFLWPCSNGASSGSWVNWTEKNGSLYLYQFIRVLAVAILMFPARSVCCPHTQLLQPLSQLSEAGGREVWQLPAPHACSEAGQCGPSGDCGNAGTGWKSPRIRFGRLQFQQESEGTWRASKTGEPKATWNPLCLLLGENKQIQVPSQHFWTARLGHSRPPTYQHIHSFPQLPRLARIVGLDRHPQLQQQGLDVWRALHAKLTFDMPNVVLTTCLCLDAEWNIVNRTIETHRQHANRRHATIPNFHFTICCHFQSSTIIPIGLNCWSELLVNVPCWEFRILLSITQTDACQWRFPFSELWNCGSWDHELDHEVRWSLWFAMDY